MVWAPTLSNPHLRWRCYLKMSFYSCLEGLTAPLWVLGQPLEFEEGLAAWRAVEPMLWRKWSWLGGDWDGGQYMAGEWGAITALLGLQGQEWGGGGDPQMPPFPLDSQEPLLFRCPSWPQRLWNCPICRSSEPCFTLPSPSILPNTADAQPALPTSCSYEDTSECPSWGQQGGEM